MADALQFVASRVGIPYFELAAGVRMHGFISDVIGVSESTSVTVNGRGAYERLYLEPVGMVRVPFDIFHIELLAGLPFAIAGDAVPVDTTPRFILNVSAHAYVALGFGVQFDAMPERSMSRMGY